jgi:GNAT superfamily N-acetyltransferase
MNLNIRFVTDSDFEEWSSLWEGYNTFYKRSVPENITKSSWQRFLDPKEPMYALVAVTDGKLVGLTHYLFHRNTVMIFPTCYLQDLFTSELVRGRGVGQALIEAVYEKAKAAGSTRVYWQTHETNQVAMKLYEKVATRSGFLSYKKDLI